MDPFKENNTTTTTTTPPTAVAGPTSSDAKTLEDEIERKKTAIRKKIQERVLKTREEMQALNSVKQELEKLDMSIDQDVVILREKIDIVARDLSHAHSQFIKKEKEYTQAKTLYEKKLEDKKRLTDHLNVIIFENEKRKEKKLEELMNSLSKSDEQITWEGFSSEAADTNTEL